MVERHPSVVTPLSVSSLRAWSIHTYPSRTCQEATVTLTSGCQGHSFNPSAASPGPLTQPLQVLQPALSHTLLILEVPKLLMSPLMTQGCVGASTEGLAHLPLGSAEASPESQGSLWEACCTPRQHPVRKYRSPLSWCPPDILETFPCHPRAQPRAGRAWDSFARRHPP